jgi:hypothetical protein
MIKEPVDETLLQVALCKKGNTEEIRSAWYQLATSKGIQELTLSNALRIYVREISCFIIDLRISPRTGADRIAHAVESVREFHSHDFDTFLYASSEMRDRPNELHIFEAGIREAARELCK